MKWGKKISYARKVLPAAIRRGLSAAVTGRVHLILMVADHFEPAIDPEDGYKRVPRAEQQNRVECWAREYPKIIDRWRDHDGRPLVHTYFYPAEQYDEGLLDQLAEHCHAGWGEVEVHLHHGMSEPDTAGNTRRTIQEFCDQLTVRHRCLAAAEGSGQARYAFVHGNFALANSAGGRFCGVDSELKILAGTGCYADFTLPTGLPHPAQIAKINSVYECGRPLDEAAAHRAGDDLAVGRRPQIFPIIVQGPLIADVGRSFKSGRLILDTGAIKESKPLTLERLALWKKARIHVHGRPDWLFIKLFCHSMNPGQKDVVAGDSFRKFLEQFVGGASDRNETLHFVTAREMANILLAACDGRDGNPGDYRDYRFRRWADVVRGPDRLESAPVGLKG